MKPGIYYTKNSSFLGVNRYGYIYKPQSTTITGSFSINAGHDGQFKYWNTDTNTFTDIP